MTSKRIAAAVLLVAALAARTAEGDVIHLKSPSTCVTEKGSTAKLPAGYFLDEEKWADRDAEKKKAEEDATRFKAENESLRASAAASPIGFKAAVVLFVLGAAAGGAGFWYATK